MHSTSPILSFQYILFNPAKPVFYFRINSAGPKETIELSQVTGKEKQTVDNFTLSVFYISPKGNILFLEHTVFTLQYS